MKIVFEKTDKPDSQTGIKEPIPVPCRLRLDKYVHRATAVPYAVLSASQMRVAARFASESKNRANGTLVFLLPG